MFNRLIKMNKQYINELIKSLTVGNDRLQRGSEVERSYMLEKTKKLLKELEREE